MSRAPRLIVALGVDNLGSGLFLPLLVVYLTGPVGVPVAVASAVLTAATVVGLLVPAVAGGLVDRAGPGAVVLGGQLFQAAGMVAYLIAGWAAGGPAALVWVGLGALLVTVGTQAFYSALTLLIIDASTGGPTEPALARADMVRSGAFGGGALVAGVLLATAGPSVLPVVLAVDAVTFVVAAGLLASGHLRRPARAEATEDGALVDGVSTGGAGPRSALRDAPFRLLVAVAVLLALPVDVFLVAFPVYTVNILRAPGWVPGVCLALLTAASATAATAVVAATSRLRRTTSLALAAVASAAWAAVTAFVAALPTGWAVTGLVAATVALIVGALVSGPRLPAIAEASAPPARRGAYLAAFQYAYTAAQLATPALVGLFAVAAWLPWAIVVLTSLTAAALCRRLETLLPPYAVLPRPVEAGRNP